MKRDQGFTYDDDSIVMDSMVLKSLNGKMKMKQKILDNNTNIHLKMRRIHYLN